MKLIFFWEGIGNIRIMYLDSQFPVSNPVNKLFNIVVILIVPAAGFRVIAQSQSISILGMSFRESAYLYFRVSAISMETNMAFKI
jgi:hypothetical protein